MTNEIVNINKKIGMIVKIYRTKKNLSQDKLAGLAGLNKNSIGVIERGESSPSVDTLYKIALALNVELKDLVDIKKFDLYIETFS